jgi:LmbE family N-acetylglucosaminyl deacetylase
MDLRGRRLTAVFAHPDDESFGPGGTLAKYSARGVEVALVCATRGEDGSIGHSKTYGPALLGRIRQAELEAAVEVLGIRRLHLLGYPDRHVASVALERGTDDVLAMLREGEPEVVITFHPSGISGHTDHQAVTAFTVRAVERLQEEARGDRADWRSRLRLHFYTIPASVARQVTYRELPLVPDEDLTIALDTSAYAEVKRRAIFCHKTQIAFYERLVSMPGPDGRFAIERYVTHGAPRRPEGSPLGDDLFAGVPDALAPAEPGR